METAMRVGALLGSVVWLAAASGGAGAGEAHLQPKAVVELFTSQGCSSCPPADALFAELADRNDLVTLAYHIDYWDYIGWPDSFGSKENSDRQRAYAERWGSSRVYTPQLVVNGAEDVVGSRRDEVTAAIAGSSLPLPVSLSVTAKNMLKIRVDPKAGLPDAMIWLVTYRNRANVAIERGENEGETIAYTQIVTGRQLLGMWEAATGTVLKMPLDEVLVAPSTGVAVLVQEEQDGLPGQMLGAALLEP
jgi:hypothetical protein